MVDREHSCRKPQSDGDAATAKVAVETAEIPAAAGVAAAVVVVAVVVDADIAVEVPGTAFRPAPRGSE